MRWWFLSRLAPMRMAGRRTRTIAAVIAAMVLIQGSALLALPLVRVGAAQATLTGALSVIFADPAPGTTLPVNDTRYFLRQSDGSRTELILDAAVVAPFGGVRPLIGQDITATVNVPVGPMIASNAPRTVTAITLAPGARLQPRATVLGSQPFANVLCKFSDKPTEPQTPGYFQGLMQLGTGSVGSWWQQVSYGDVDVTTSQTFPASGSWYVIGTEASYLTDPKTMNEDKIATDCTKAAKAVGVDLTPFKGINFMLNDSLVSYSLGGQGTVTDQSTTPPTQLLSSRGLTWLMPWAYGIVPPNGNTATASGPGPMEHEMGHAFLLWHSGNINGVEYQDSWDPMGNPYVNCNFFSPPMPYGCGGQSLTSYDKDFLGWTASRRFDYSGVTRQITLDPLMPGTGTHYLLVKIPHTSTTNFTTVEMRLRTGIDATLPGDGVIIHEIDTTNTSVSKRITSANGDMDALRPIGQPYTVPGTPAPVNVIVKSVAGNTATVVLSNGIAPTITTYTGNFTTGSVVTLTGTNFSPEATVSFNGTPATAVTWNSSTSITATVPTVPSVALPTVTNPDGLSGAIRPNAGPPAHGTGSTMPGAGPLPPGHTTGGAPGGPIMAQPNRH